MRTDLILRGSLEVSVSILILRSPLKAGISKDEANFDFDASNRFNFLRARVDNRTAPSRTTIDP